MFCIFSLYFKKYRRKSKKKKKYFFINIKVVCQTSCYCNSIKDYIDRAKLMMLKNKLILIAIILLCFVQCLFALKEQDNTKHISESVRDFIVTTGLGMAMDFNSNSQYMKNGAVINIGVELPLTNEDLFSLELNLNTWFSKSKVLENPYGKFDNYYELNDNYYTQSGLSAAIKYYLRLHPDFRVSVSLGWLFLTSSSYCVFLQSSRNWF